MTAIPCFECDAPAVHEHHVIPRSIGGTKTVALCEDCHGKVHGRDLRTQALTRAALAAKKARGERVGTCPYGYRTTPSGHLTPDADEQEIVATVRDMRATGLSLRAIAARLTARGIRTRGGSSFAANQVARIVRDDATGRHRVSVGAELMKRDKSATASEIGPLFAAAGAAR